MNINYQNLTKKFSYIFIFFFLNLKSKIILLINLSKFNNLLTLFINIKFILYIFFLLKKCQLKSLNK